MRILIRFLQVVLPLAVLALAGFAAFMMIRNRPVVETQPVQIAPPGVRVHVVELQDVALSVVSEGTVRPRTESQLVPEISGRVTSISDSFVEGGFFETDDVLVTIDPFDYQQAMVSARAQLAQTRLRLAEEEAEAEVAQREWEELGRGNPRELTLRKPQLEDANAAVAAAEANVVRAERDLERAEIRAPYAGRVRRKSVDVGQFVTVGNPVATVYAVDVAEIRLPLPDEELAYLDLPLSYRGTDSQPGPSVKVRATFAGQTYSWDGRVMRTESEIDPVSRMVQVVAEVRDPYRLGPDRDRPPLAVGMYVDAEIAGRRFNQIAVVPREALRGRNQVMVVDDESRMRFREVELLRMTAESIYVEKGLMDGERVAISTVDSPTEGMLVQVTQEETSDLMVDWVPEVPIEESLPLTSTAASAGDVDLAQPPVELPAVVSDPVTGDQEEAVVASDTPSDSFLDVVNGTEEVITPSAVAVAVLPFTDLSQQAADGGLGATFASVVSERLSEVDVVTVVPAASDASWVVGGAVQQEGDEVRITARVVESDAGDVVQVVKVDGILGALSGAQEDIATAVTNKFRELLGASEPKVSPLPVRAIVAVRPFANLSQEPVNDQLAVDVKQAVTKHLEQISTLTVVDTDEGAHWLVAGGIQRIGNTVRITARVVDRTIGEVIQAVKIDGPVDELIRLQAEVASAVGRSVQETLAKTPVNAG